uniref:Putative fasciclin 1 n=1 Tax=Corethrella appendiculata TaxID=1370023 RepID=U5EXZ7_9DIPT
MKSLGCPMLIMLMMFISLAKVNGLTLVEKIRDDADLSQFYDLLERSKAAMSSLEYRSCTLFAPTNQAFQRYAGNRTNVLYHLSTVATTLETLGSTIYSDMEGNPPLYITRKKRQNNEDIYVNNALILKSRSNVQLTNAIGKKQVLHIIDDVLTPLTVNPSSSVEVYNPDAFQFITHAESLDINQHRVRSFRQKIITNKKEYVYQAVGGHTFFIPVEEGFKPPPRPDMIDKKVIDGHVIPNKVIFTEPAPLDEPLETLAFEDNVKVTITFFTQTDGKSTKTYVKSNTIAGDSKHPQGVVLAEIVKANIPVKNGVVHLIHRPLMVIDTTVIQFLEEKEDGPLFKFYEVVVDYGGEFMQTINTLRDVTIFAPSNEAWNNPTLANIIRNREKIREILNLHIVRERISTEKIKQNNQQHIYQVPTNAERKFLYFNVITNQFDRNQTVTVEGGGVNATILQGDIAATNGYVHIIDRVLGVPYTTVQEKLRTDPMLNETYYLGRRSGINVQLNDTTRRFTYFVPRDKAWQISRNEFPTATLKLFMPEYSYHAKSILERHLVIADRIFTMNDLKNMANDSIVLPTVRDSLRIRVKEEDKRFYIQWRNKWIPVFRPDVECTNGIIHVIDRPLLTESDVTVGGSQQILPSTINLIIANIVMIILTKLFI